MAEKTCTFCGRPADPPPHPKCEKIAREILRDGKPLSWARAAAIRARRDDADSGKT